MLALASCSDEVPLGAWGNGAQGGDTSSGGQASTGGDVSAGGLLGAGGSTGGVEGSSGSAGIAGADGCGQLGAPGLLNRPGLEIGVTMTYTDWFWPAPVESMEWDVTFERENNQNGYFWGYQFGFVASVGGFIGLQEHGSYQADPPDGPRESTRMALFWIAGPPIAAELGDIAYPDARTYLDLDRGLAWWAIHARYDFEICRAYRMRIARDGFDENGDAWYGGWILDTVSGVETLIGRILVPRSWGLLSGLSSMWTAPIEQNPAPETCAEIEPGSVVATAPVGNDGAIRPTMHSNHFGDPLRCPSSRTSELAGAVRHEIGVAP